MWRADETYAAGIGDTSAWIRTAVDSDQTPDEMGKPAPTDAGSASNPYGLLPLPGLICAPRIATANVNRASCRALHAPLRSSTYAKGFTVRKMCSCSAPTVAEILRTTTKGLR